MLIAVGSKNPAKTEAVRLAFQKVWPDELFVVEGIEVGSGVSDQPMTDKESIKGATTRAKRAIKALSADYGVGLEGGIQKLGKRWFDAGWIVIVDKEGREGIGSSIKMETPPEMIKLVEKGIELGEVDDIVFKTKNSKQGLGHFGLMTNGALSRTEAYTAAVISALSRFLHPEHF